MKGGLRAAGATDLIAPDHRLDAVSAVHLRQKLIPAIIIAAIAIASLIVTLLLWSL